MIKILEPVPVTPPADAAAYAYELVFVIKKINEMIDKLNEIEEYMQRSHGCIPPKRYFKEDYGHRYEVDEFGNPIFHGPMVQ